MVSPQVDEDSGSMGGAAGEAGGVGGAASARVSAKRSKTALTQAPLHKPTKAASSGAGAAARQRSSTHAPQATNTTSSSKVRIYNVPLLYQVIMPATAGYSFARCSLYL